MRRLIAVCAMAVLVSGVSLAPALADSASVKGTGTYKKLVVKNGKNTLVFKLSAPGGKCEVKYLRVDFRDRDGTRFGMDGGCYPGAVWGASLVKGKQQKLVACSSFSLKYDKSAKVWTGKIPRSCLKGLAGAVKVTQSYVDDYSPVGGSVPKTGYIKQG